MYRWGLLTIAGLGFLALVTLNAGGYRYGASDQAFYIPVVLQSIAPDLYPHDSSLIEAQDRFFVFDDWFAPLVNLTGTSVSQSFLAAYVLTLLLFFGAAITVGRNLYSSPWSIGGLVIALTMRHRIPDTAVNSLEGYFHPRLLAFAIGLWALATFLQGRTKIALTIVALALLAHPTTGLWFALWIGVAGLVSDRQARGWLFCLAVLTTTVLVWLLSVPLRPQLTLMDPEWSGLLSTKDYLISAQWPFLTWVGNLGMAVLIVAIYYYRRVLHLASKAETGLVVGVGVLVGLFLLSVPFASQGVALVVQLQFNRTFWLLDFFGTCYLIWLLVEGPWTYRLSQSSFHPTPRTAVVAILFLLAFTRGSYVTFVERAGQPIVQTEMGNRHWTEVMAWAAEQPVGTHFLADPIHAARYGSSVRAASGRDVFVEFFKDTGMAIYSKDVAQRVASRLEALGDFGALDTNKARALAAQYDLDYLITEADLDLPETRRAGPLQVYDLNGTDPLMALAAAREHSNHQDN